MLGELLEHPGDVRVGTIDLVERDQDRYIGGPRVVDRFHGLGHHAVVGRDHQHDDVGDLGAASTHRGECRVAGRVDEGEAPPSDSTW